MGICTKYININCIRLNQKIEIHSTTNQNLFGIKTVRKLWNAIGRDTLRVSQIEKVGDADHYILQLPQGEFIKFNFN